MYVDRMGGVVTGAGAEMDAARTERVETGPDVLREEHMRQNGRV